MASTIGDRIKDARRNKGLTQTELGQRLGLTHSAVSLWESGGNQNLRPHNLFALAKELEVSPEWLVTGRTMKQSGLSAPTPEFVALRAAVDRVGTEGDLAVSYDLAPFGLRSEWLKERQIDPERALVIEARDDSMESTIWCEDWVVADASDHEVSDGNVYALSLNQKPRLRRLYERLDGSVLVSADNPKYPDEAVDRDQVAELMIGRAIYRFGEL